MQEQASNHLKLLWSKAMVVIVEEKVPPDGISCGSERRAKANHPMRYRKHKDDVKTGGSTPGQVQGQPAYCLVGVRYKGGVEEDAKGRKIETKTLVVIAVEVEEKKLGRIRFRIIHDASAHSLIPFIKENITPDSVVITDGWLGYAPLKKENYEHVVKNISQSKENASKLLPHVHLVVSLIKRWLMGTHQGAVSQKHLADYLDEYASGLTGDCRHIEANFFIGLCSKRYQPNRHHDRRLSPEKLNDHYILYKLELSGYP